MSKSSKAIVTQRVDDVKRLLVVGAESSDIRKFALAHEWGLSDRQLQRYTKIAYRQMAKAASRDYRQLLGLHLSKRRALYARCVKANENRTALQVLRDEAALQGLYPATKIAHSNPDDNGGLTITGKNSPMCTPEELAQRLMDVGRELAAKTVKDK
jgi:hypothetical protein